MPCLIALIAMVAPRFAIILVVLFSDYIGNAYETVLWPFLGFLFTPVGTLAYAWAWHRPPSGEIEGFAFAVVVIAFLMDLGIFGGGGATANKGKKKKKKK